MASGKNISLKLSKSKTTIVGIGTPGGGFIGPLINTNDRRFDRRAKEEKIKHREQQILEKQQFFDIKLVDASIVSGSILTLRDEDGNIILFEDRTDPNKNVERHDQFISVELYNDEFDINAATDAIDFSIVELKSIENRIDLLDEFLRTFRKILPEIPNEDLQFILRRGIEEQGGELITQEEFDNLTEGNFSKIIQRLLDLQDESEIDNSEIESLTIQLETMGELVLEASTNDGGLNLKTLIQRVINELRLRNMVPDVESLPTEENFAIISVNAKRFLNNQTLGKEFRNYGGTEPFADLEEELVADKDVDRNRNPKDIDRDELRRQRQIDDRNRERANAQKNIEEEENPDRNLDIDVVFMTEFGETTALRMTLPFDVKVPIITNIHGFPETVTGVRLRVVDTGAFRGWFIDDLKKTDSSEYVTGLLEPGSRFTLTSAYERFDDEGRDIPDEKFDDKIGDGERQTITIPEPEFDSADSQTTIEPPVEPIKDQAKEKPDNSLIIEGGGRKKLFGHDPDVPILPLEDDEIPVSEIPVDRFSPSGSENNIIEIKSEPITTPIVEKVIIIPPLPKPIKLPILTSADIFRKI